MKSPKLLPGLAAPLRDRIALLDILRGLALVSILFVNMEYYSQTVYDGWLQPAFRDNLDLAARWFVIAFFQLKAYLLFALLFGYGIGMQLARLEERNGRTVQRNHLRRMFALCILGILHGVLLFSGDILVTYAFLGALAALCWRAQPARLLALSGYLFVFGLIVGMLLLLLPMEGIDAEFVAAVRDVYAQGSFSEVVVQRVADLALALPFILIVQGPMAMVMLFVGIAMAKRGVLTRPNEHRPLLRRMLRVGLLVGLIGGAEAATLALVGAPDGMAAGIAFLIQLLTGPAWCAGVVALVAILWTELAPAWLGIFRSLGRMSLTVYIAQSLLCALIFTSYGLGWYAVVGPAACLAIAVGVAVFLGAFCHWWLRRFRIGPLEWLLRSCTYGRWQPLRYDECSQHR